MFFNILNIDFVLNWSVEWSSCPIDLRRGKSYFGTLEHEDEDNVLVVEVICSLEIIFVNHWK